MEGELFKIGRRTKKLIQRHFILRESALMIFKDAESLTAQGKHTFAPN
jgi:hypothetical protein